MNLVSVLCDSVCENPRRASIALIVLLAALCSGTANAGGPAIFHVDDDAPSGGDGLSWNTAFDDLEDAVALARSNPGAIDEIRVAQGTYVPSYQLDAFTRSATFTFVEGTSMKGGYAGIGATDPGDRDIDLYETILSGDLNADDGPDFTNYSDNCWHVVWMSVGNPNTDSAVFEGFTVRGGNADGIASQQRNVGGAIWNRFMSAPIRDCKFIDNSAIAGGGAIWYFANGVIEDCEFESNRTFGGGGAVLCDLGNVAPTIRNSVFLENFTQGSGGDNGGAIRMRSDSGVVEDCQFDGNYSSGKFGGGVAITGESAVLNRCIVINNRARGGGGGVFYNGESSKGSYVANCLIAGNSVGIGFPSGGDGGGILVSGGDYAGRMFNCTVVYNHASEFNGGLGFTDVLATIDLVNCVFWGNTDSGASVQDAQMGGVGALTINYSCVQGWTGLLGGTGNFGNSPEFVDSDGADNDPLTYEDNDYRLGPSSPYIDAGSNSALATGVIEDLDGEARRQDDPDTTDSGEGFAPIVDVGAYEKQNPNQCPADITDSGGSGPDGSVDVFDLLAILANWGTSGTGANIAPPNDTVDVFDLLQVLGDWGPCT